MASKKLPPTSKTALWAGRTALWALVEKQHGVVTRAQLLDLGLSSQAVQHRISGGRLHPIWRGVYALGRPQVTQHGRWMAAVLSCGPEAALSHESAAALWEIDRNERGRLRDERGRLRGEIADRRVPIEVSIPARLTRRRPGIVVYRRAGPWPRELTRRNGIPVTTPVLTLVDLASRLRSDQLEAAINEADKRDLTDPEALRSALDAMAPRPGIAPLRQMLDRLTFTLTDSELERRFLPIARRAGLPPPLTGVHLNGFKVDFYWPGLGLVVETDGLRYHRTPAQQARDRLRDQAHTAAGLTPLRFTNAQVRFEPDQVQGTVTAVARRLRGGSPG